MALAVCYWDDLVRRFGAEGYERSGLAAEAQVAVNASGSDAPMVKDQRAAAVGSCLRPLRLAAQQD